MQSVLITGGTGLLAINWAYHVKDKYEIVLAIHQREIRVNGFNMQKVNVAHVELLQDELEKLNPRLVINTIGLTNVEACENDPSKAYQVNVVLAANLAKTTASLHIPFVHISTDHLFDGSKQFSDESAPPCPLNVYGATKLQAENEVLFNNPAALVIRTNFYGWGTSYRHSFSDTIISCLRSGNRLDLFSDVYYTPVLIEALVNTVHELLEKKASGVFNIASDDRISKYEFGLKVARKFGLDAELINPVHLKDKTQLTKRPLDMSLSNKKVCRLLGTNVGTVDEHLDLLHEREISSDVCAIRSL